MRGPRTLFCFSFRISSVILRRHLKGSAFWLLQLWGGSSSVFPRGPLPKGMGLSWTQLQAYQLISWPLAHQDCELSGLLWHPWDVTWMDRLHVLSQLFLLPFHRRKAGAKSHFENLSLSVGDTLETTLLVWLIARWKLIVCLGHRSLKS